MKKPENIFSDAKSHSLYGKNNFSRLNDSYKLVRNENMTHHETLLLLGKKVRFVEETAINEMCIFKMFIKKRKKKCLYKLRLRKCEYKKNFKLRMYFFYLKSDICYTLI